MTKSNSNSLFLTRHEEALSRGTARLTIEPTNESAHSVMSHFLRAFRGRSDLVKLLPDSPEFTSRIEKLRTHLFARELDQAERVAGELESSPLGEFELGELTLEKARLRRFQGDLEGALTLSESALANPTLSEVSQMTCRQLRGSIFLENKEFDRAIEELTLALALADVFRLAGSAFSARAFLVQALCELGRKEDAKAALKTLTQELEPLPQEELWVDRLLTVIRAETHFHRVFGPSDAWRTTALEALELANWIGDANTARKCKSDLEACGTSEGPHPVRRFKGWTFLPSRNLILVPFPKSVVRLEKNPIARKLLNALIGRKLSLAELFEEVYGFGFDPARHTQHMRSTLTRIRKLLPEGALRVEDGLVFLAN